MSDLEKLRELLTSFGVLWTEEGRWNGIMLRIDNNGACKKVCGYDGFGTFFVFEYDGKFREMGAWE